MTVVNAPPSASACTTTSTKEEHVVLRRQKCSPTTKFRKNYVPSDFRVIHVELDFELHDKDTQVKSKIVFCRVKDGISSLYLDGESLTLKRLSIDGNILEYSKCCGKEGENDKKKKAGEKEFVFGLMEEEDKLCIPGDVLPEKAETEFTVEATVLVNPVENLQLMGLYKSRKLFCTQCEAEGFRRITYFLDRPDIMATYKVRIAGDKKTCPVMLSNGNNIGSGDCDGQAGRHFVIFEDPFPKPCYLFAVVAGDLKSILDSFVTMSGRKIRLEIFSEPEHVGKLLWAMECIKKAMKWDEEAFGREYDLDVFNIVCAQDFNMGAMENKGLNVFNTSLLLADENNTTDTEFHRILTVVGHEYFHNWTGNRVTCRDWFQLTLKEGLTVYRDQQFTRHITSKAVKRIEDVLFIKTRQFSEDSGPMTHPIRPESYIAMDNFYTATVYDKGAEVIRMYDTFLGTEGFRKGMDLYFKRHDGEAVTCDQFRQALADANNMDLKQFENWYLQHGTPLVEVVESVYDASKSIHRLRLRQSVPSVKNPAHLPLHIPVRVGLLGKQSKKDLLKETSKILEFKELDQTFEIADVSEEPVVSIFRDYSAPVRLKFDSQTDNDLSFLMAYDSDDFNRWEAGQTLATKLLLSRAELLRGVTHVNSKQKISTLPALPKVLTEAFAECLKKAEEGDKSLQAYTLCLPDEEALHIEMPQPVDHEAVHQACQSLRSELCRMFQSELRALYQRLSEQLHKGKDGGSRGVGIDRCLDKEMVGKRRLRNTILYFLCGDLCSESAGATAMKHFQEADCMTDKLAGFKYACSIECKHTDEVIKKFLEDAAGDDLIIDKWFTIQALADRADCISRVKALQAHAKFTLRNPNRLRSLIFAFARNSGKFHCMTGEGYELLRKVIVEVDKFNPQVAARACGYLINWKRVDTARQELMKKELRCILDTVGLSNDTCEIASKGMAVDVDDGKLPQK